MAQPVEHDAGHRFHVRGRAALGFPINRARQAGQRVIHRRLTDGINGLGFDFGDGLGFGRRLLRIVVGSLSLKHLRLVLGGFGRLLLIGCVD